MVFFSSVKIDTGPTSMVGHRIFVPSPKPKLLWLRAQTGLVAQVLPSLAEFSAHFRYHLGHSGGLGKSVVGLCSRKKDWLDKFGP